MAEDSKVSGVYLPKMVLMKISVRFMREKNEMRCNSFDIPYAFYRFSRVLNKEIEMNKFNCVGKITMVDFREVFRQDLCRNCCVGTSIKKFRHL